MKLAYSTLACPAWTVEQAAQAATQYGYDAIEWRLADGEVLTPQTPAEVKRRVVEATRQHGLAVACLDTNCRFVQATDAARQAVVQDAMEMTDLAVELGAPRLRVFGGPIPADMTREALLQPTAAALHQAATYAASKNVKLVLETHDDWSQSLDALALVEAAQSSNLGVLWDVHHPYRMGETPAQTYHNLHDGREIAHVHIKDARRDPTDKTGWHLCLLESGELPVAAIVQILQQGGYTGYISVEWEKKWHPEIEEPDIALPQFAALLRQYLNA